MRILHIDFTGTFNEEMSYQENIMTKCHYKDGHEVTMLSTCYMLDGTGNKLYTPPVDKIMKNGVRLIRMNYHTIINHYITIKIRKVDNVYQLLEQLLPDIIFFHGPQTIELLTIVKYVKRNPGIHIFIDNHADWINSMQSWLSRYILHKIIWKFCIGRIQAYTEKFYGVTPLRCDFLRDIYKIPIDKIELLLMGADDEKIDFSKKDQIRRVIRNKHGISETDFVIITGGKIDEKKNIHLLLRAVNELTNENIKLIIFGSSDQQMKKMIDDLSRSDRILNIGWIVSEKVYDYFLASDLALFPGTHSVLWEQSVGTGLPGVFKYWKGMDHVDIGGNSKFLYNDQVDEIKSIIEEIVDNKIEYQRMKTIAEEIGVKKFSYQTISRKAIQL